MMKFVTTLVVLMIGLTLTTTKNVAAQDMAALSVPIVVDAYLPDARPNAPVTFGVPFAQGKLQQDHADRVRIIDDTGAVIPHQQVVNATWHQGGVRWLLIDMQVNAGRSYTLQVAEPQTPATDIANIENGVIRMNTGLYTGTVTTRGFDLFANLKFRNVPVAFQGKDVFSAFYVEHEKRGLFRSDLDPGATVTLEEAGPLRATLKADGWYTNVTGEMFCRYSIRLHFFKNRPEVKIEHTFIYTGLSAQDRIVAMGMKVQRIDPASTAWRRANIGDGDLLKGQATNTADHVVQIASERDRLDFYAPLPNGNMKLADHGGGWMYGEGAGQFTVAIRDAWQQYPWSLNATGGAIDIALWPREAGLLDTTWDGYWSNLTDRQKRFMAEHMGRRTDVTLDKWMDILRGSTNATGAAKTHELWYTPTLIRELPREVAYPTIAHTDTAYMCSTQALDLVPHVSANDGRFESEEVVLRQMLTMVQQAVASNNWYGWWDWGGYHQHLNPHGPNMSRIGLWADDAGMERWHRARPKSHYQWGRFPWLQYMRTGDREWLRYAQTFTLYSADRAHSHHDGNGRNNGSEFHYDNSVVPWLGGYRKYPTGDQTWSPLQSKDDYVYAYWLTGSRRALDVLKANGELLLSIKDPIGFKPGFERGNDIRNAGMMLERVMMLYQATSDARYRALADRIAALFIPLDTTEKVITAEYDPVTKSNFHQAATWAYQGMWFYDRIVGDPAFHKVLRLFIDRARDVDAGFTFSNGGGQNGSPRSLTYGYLLTGDHTYLDLARPELDYLVGNGVDKLQFTPGGKQELSGMPSLLGAIASASATDGYDKPVLTWRSFTQNKDPYHAGTRAFIREENDHAWHFIIASDSGGIFTLYNPDGSAAQTVTLDVKTRNWARVEVPADGQHGDYAVICTTIDPDVSPRLARRARIVDCTLPVTIEIGVPGRDLGVTGRAYTFKPDPAAPDAYVSVVPLDPLRYLTLHGAAAGLITSTRGAVPRLGSEVQLPIPSFARSRVLTMRLSLDPHDCYHAHEGSRMWGFHGILPFLAASSADYFVPNVPATLPLIRP